ncbi:MAG: ATP-dependent Clp protease ATP-binding subunit, partial [Spirochaetaceae bacterium]|nr:ATP-dependent Clp protease ATP-binding subunit [Spirochaetaceae bacterium]
EIQLSELSARLNEQGFELTVKSGAKNYLIENGYEPAYGARPMRRLIQREIEDPVAFAIISGKASTANEIVIDFKKEKITISYRGKKEAKQDHSEALEHVEELAK